MAAIVDKKGMCLVDRHTSGGRTKTAYRRWRACCVSSAVSEGCLSGQPPPRGVGSPAPVCRDLIGLGLQYRLLPHILARFDHWSLAVIPILPLQIAGSSRRRLVGGTVSEAPGAGCGAGSAVLWRGLRGVSPAALALPPAGRLSPLRTSLPSPVIRVNARAFCQPSEVCGIRSGIGARRG
jgi:hypothetical protein